MDLFVRPSYFLGFVLKVRWKIRPSLTTSKSGLITLKTHTYINNKDITLGEGGHFIRAKCVQSFGFSIIILFE